MGGPRSPSPKWWIRDAAAQVGLTKVEMADGWTKAGLPAVEGRVVWTQVGLPVGEMGDGTGAGEGAGEGNGGWEDGGAERIQMASRLEHFESILPKLAGGLHPRPKMTHR
jgi:hypothetical protein